MKSDPNPYEELALEIKNCYRFEGRFWIVSPEIIKSLAARVRALPRLSGGLGESDARLCEMVAASMAKEPNDPESWRAWIVGLQELSAKIRIAASVPRESVNGELVQALKLSRRALNLRRQFEARRVSEHATLDPWTVVQAENEARAALPRAEGQLGVSENDRWELLCEAEDAESKGHDETAKLFRRIAASASVNAELVDALRAVLLFLGSSDWSPEEWTAITGSDEATTRVLCDTVRAALARAEEAGHE